MSLSTEKIIYELTSIDISIKCYHEHMLESRKKINKLITQLKPALGTKRGREGVYKNHEMSSTFNSSNLVFSHDSSIQSELGDIVASLNQKPLINQKETRNSSSKIQNQLSHINSNCSKEKFSNLFCKEIEKSREIQEPIREEGRKIRKLNSELNFSTLTDNKVKFSPGPNTMIPCLKENKAYDNSANKLNHFSDKTNNKQQTDLLGSFVSTVSRVKELKNESSYLFDSIQNQNVLSIPSSDIKENHGHNLRKSQVSKKRKLNHNTPIEKDEKQKDRETENLNRLHRVGVQSTGTNKNDVFLPSNFPNSSVFQQNNFGVNDFAFDGKNYPVQVPNQNNLTINNNKITNNISSPWGPIFSNQNNPNSTNFLFNNNSTSIYDRNIYPNPIFDTQNMFNKPLVQTHSNPIRNFNTYDHNYNNDNLDNNMKWD